MSPWLRLDLGEACWFLAAIAIGAAAGVYGYSFIEGNERAVDVIVNVFAILAGFILAILTFLGGARLRGGSLRFARVQRARIRRRLVRQELLFYIYLATLILIFMSELLKSSHPCIIGYFERLYFGLACLGLVLSLRLPGYLVKFQIEQLDDEIAARSRRIRSGEE